MKPSSFFFFFIVLQFLLFNNTYCQQPEFKVMFYNVENLFDTKNDSTVNDEDFLPTSKKYWTYDRYNVKISNLYKTIVACGQGRIPDLVGMCEIENVSCLKSLVLYSSLSAFEYRFVHYESSDPRGIDVALLYNPKTFKVLKHQKIGILKDGKTVRTRDILMVTGVILPSDTVVVFVNHWPSRRGGVEKSEVKRSNVANQLRSIIDSLRETNENLNVIAMGDFNDTPVDISISKNLGATSCITSNGFLCNAACWYTSPGTYKFKGDWSVFDQFILSRPLLKAFPRTISNVFNEPFLLEDDDVFGGVKPFKTYNGMKYLGGFSDHLPVMLRLRK